MIICGEFHLTPKNKNKQMKKIFSLLFFITSVNCFAQFPRVDIPGPEIRKITSPIVAGQEYELQILLPGGYKNSNQKYPVVVCPGTSLTSSADREQSMYHPDHWIVRKLLLLVLLN